MPGVAALKAALAAWQESSDEDDRIKAQRVFESLEPGQQSIILDAAIVANSDIRALHGSFDRVWRLQHGDEADTWLKELGQQGLVQYHHHQQGLVQYNKNFFDMGIYRTNRALEELARRIVQDPQSCHYGSRLWVQDGEVLGHQQGHSVLAANLKPEVTTAAALVDRQLSSMSSIDFSEARILVGLQQLPSQLISGQLQQLLYLHLSGKVPNTLAQLPYAVERLTALRVLDLGYCARLEALPESFGELTQLQEVNLHACCKLAALPESFGQLAKLEKLMLGDCHSLTALPESFGDLSGLRTLDLDRCRQLSRLPESFGQLKALTHLSVEECSSLVALPDAVGKLAALQVLYLGECSQLKALPESFGDLSALKLLYLNRCRQLSRLPESLGQLTAMTHLSATKCSSLVQLPESFGQLAKLEMLMLGDCNSLTALPESFGDLSGLRTLCLDRCRQLSRLPESFGQLKALTYLTVEECSSLVQPLPGPKWTPERQIRHVMRLQRSQPAILKLATQQETMLTTLERMSWLAVLLATATFIAFMQPPGGLKDDQVLVSDNSACAWDTVPGGAAASSRMCALLVFFILDGLSFGFSMGCVMMIIVLSMPRLKYEDDSVEAGRFWLLLLVTWVLLYCAVMTGFGAFIASGLAVFNRWGVVVGPVIPGMLLLVVGFIAIVTRFNSLHPGMSAVWAALSPWSSRIHAKAEDPDIEMGQSLFWKHCKQVLAPKQQQQQQATEAVSGQSAGPDETTRLLAPLDPGASSSGVA